MDANFTAPHAHGSAKDLTKVSAASRTAAVAGAIAGVIREHKHAEVQAIGTGAVNQAVKALVLATSYLKQDSIHVAFIPEFANVTFDGNVRTVIKLLIAPCSHLIFVQPVEVGLWAAYTSPCTRVRHSDASIPGLR